MKPANSNQNKKKDQKRVAGDSSDKKTLIASYSRAQNDDLKQIKSLKLYKNNLVEQKQVAYNGLYTERGGNPYQ